MYNKYQEIQDILDNYKKQLNEPKVKGEVQQVLPIMHKHLFSEKLTINWLKKQCHIKKKCFSSWFKFYIGYHPKDYIIRHRIKASKKLLKRTEISVTQIAICTGFSSLSSFCNTFKNREGIRPTQYREDIVKYWDQGQI